MNTRLLRCLCGLVLCVACLPERERTRIKLWTCEQGRPLSVSKGLLARFEYSTMAHEVRLKVFPNPAALFRYFRTKIARGKGPDIIYCHWGWVRRFVRRGYLAPVPKSLQHSVATNYAPQLFASLMHHGKLYALPVHADPCVLLSRLPDKKPPLAETGVCAPLQLFLTTRSQPRWGVPELAAYFRRMQRTALSRYPNHEPVHQFRLFNQGLLQGVYTPLRHLWRASGNPVLFAAGDTGLQWGYAVTARSHKKAACYRLLAFLNQRQLHSRYLRLGKRLSLRRYPGPTSGRFGNVLQRIASRTTIVPGIGCLPDQEEQFHSLLLQVLNGRRTADGAARSFLLRRGAGKSP